MLYPTFLYRFVYNFKIIPFSNSFTKFKLKIKKINKKQHYNFLIKIHSHLRHGSQTLHGLF